MDKATADPRWPKLLSLTVHEFRTPMTVVAGYIRMLLKDRAGPLSDQHRRLLEEAEKSCGRLSALLGELSELSNLEAGTVSFNRGTLDLHALLAETVAALPHVPDRDVQVTLESDPQPAAIEGDAVRLRTALTSILAAIRRELVAGNRLCVRARTRPGDGRKSAWIAIAEPGRIDSLADSEPAALSTFDEWRGGCGLSLPNARRVIEAHGGAVWSPGEESKAGAVIRMPLV